MSNIGTELLLHTANFPCISIYPTFSTKEIFGMQAYLSTWVIDLGLAC
jgi:hypothetical protein